MEPQLSRRGRYNDNVLDAEDAFPLDSTESVDTDSDGIGNNADADDGDGLLDSEESIAGTNPSLPTLTVTA